jgi:hypothetical protein
LFLRLAATSTETVARDRLDSLHSIVYVAFFFTKYVCNVCYSFLYTPQDLGELQHENRRAARQASSAAASSPSPSLHPAPAPSDPSLPSVSPGGHQHHPLAAQELERGQEQGGDRYMNEGGAGEAAAVAAVGADPAAEGVVTLADLKNRE